jgi:exodeoxyribonuclease III
MSQSYKIITYNVNGIRSAINKGLIQWLKNEDPFAICFQEIKLSETELVKPLFEELGYFTNWYPAEKKGYSGVAILSKENPHSIKKGFGIDLYDSEGRVLQADFENFSLISAYFPSGSSGDIRQDVKIKFLDDFYVYINELKKYFPKLIIGGDYNICHQEIDIHNPKSNQNTSGFLPEERAWVGKFLDNGFIDSFRHLNTDPHHYTWWSYRARAKSKNSGWRIDYQCISTELENHLKSAQIHPEVLFSDHCPVSIILEF